MVLDWQLRTWSLGGDADGEVLSYPSLEEMAAFLHDLAQAHPDTVSVKEAGRSVQGKPIWLVTITDRQVLDDDKERVLMIGQEHSWERSGCLTILEMARWLLTPEAAEIRRRQVVSLIPAVNPDCWERLDSLLNANDVNLYADYTLDGKPTQPESQAVWSVLHELQPEVLCCHHGTYYGWKYLMCEGAGLSYATSMYDRTHARLLVEELHRTAEAAGFPQDRGEEDAERILPYLPGHAYHSFGSGQRLTTCVYAYHHFHTLGISTEIHYPLSGMLRCIKLLQLGNQPWRYEAVPGYPVRTVRQGAAHAFLAAYGQTASERRVSRVELWSHAHQVSLLAGWHQPVGFFLVFLSLDPADATRWHGTEVGTFLEQLAAEERIDLSGMQEAYRSQPRQKMVIDQAPPKETDGAQQLGAVRHGIAMRLRLPGEAVLRRVWLDGRSIEPSPSDGYQLWSTANGYSMLQINVPPRVTADRIQRHLFLAEYDAPRVDQGSTLI